MSISELCDFCDLCDCFTCKYYKKYFILKNYFFKNKWLLQFLIIIQKWCLSDI